MKVLSDRHCSPSPHKGHSQVVHLGKIAGDCLVFSDVHLMDPADQHTQNFIEALLLYGKQVHHVFLLGDIFEFIDASRSYFRELWRPVFQALEELKASGVAVYFSEGNHDFGFELSYRRERKWQNSWLVQWASYAGDSAFEFEHDAFGKVHLRHGDDVVTSQSYLRFRAVVKSFVAQFLLGLLPPAPMHVFFLWLARQSRKRGENYCLTKQKLLADVTRFIENGHFEKPDVLILGHIHVYADGPIHGVQTLSGPDWHTAASVLLLKAQTVGGDSVQSVIERQALGSALPANILEPIREPIKSGRP